MNLSGNMMHNPVNPDRVCRMYPERTRQNRNLEPVSGSR